MDDRMAEAMSIVRRSSAWSAGAGLIPIPLVDIGAIAAVQVKMIRDLAKVYGVEFPDVRVRAVSGGIAGSILPYLLSVGSSGYLFSMAKVIPIVGPVIAIAAMPGFASAATYAVGKVFALKGRPPGLALPVLVGSPRQVHQVAAAWPAAAASLADRFWPGPLTLVVPALPEVGAAVGGGGTVGVRHPRHDFVGALCRETGPLAVTSANRHGEPPCTTAQAAAELFDGDLLVVDGGTCDAPPSTVVDCTQSPPSCVRQGAVPWARVEEALR